MNALDAEFGQRAQAFAHLHAGQPTQAWIANLHARVDSLASGAGALPVTVHDGARGDAWVCSPRSTYVDCAIEESERYLPPMAAKLARAALRPMGACFGGTGLDRSVAINNWMLSTNLYPSLSAVDVRAVLAEAVGRWPHHTLWFRSLNDVDNRDWLAALQQAGCRLIVSRQVYLYEDWAQARLRHQNLKRDLAALERTPLRHCDDAGIGEADYARIAELYALLYLHKFSHLNPVYGEAFLRAWHRAGLLVFEGFRDESGQLASIVGMFRIGDIATAPIVGYDTAQPQQHGLYRLATACAYRACLRNGWRLNFSAGAADFKRLRGGQPAMEYSAVYARHLPALTRGALRGLSRATCGIGAPLMRRYRL